MVWMEPQHKHCCLMGHSSLVLTFPGSHSERGTCTAFPSHASYHGAAACCPVSAAQAGLHHHFSHFFSAPVIFLHLHTELAAVWESA